jgi:hypothetical protein
MRASQRPNPLIAGRLATTRFRTQLVPHRVQFTPQNLQSVPNSLNFGQLMLNTPLKFDGMKDHTHRTKESWRGRQPHVNPVPFGSAEPGGENGCNKLTTKAMTGYIEKIHGQVAVSKSETQTAQTSPANLARIRITLALLVTLMASLISVHAADSLAQAAARVALLQKMYDLDHPQIRQPVPVAPVAAVVAQSHRAVANMTGTVSVKTATPQTGPTATIPTAAPAPVAPAVAASAAVAPTVVASAAVTPAMSSRIVSFLIISLFIVSLLIVSFLLMKLRQLKLKLRETDYRV